MSLGEIALYGLITLAVVSVACFFAMFYFAREPRYDGKDNAR